MNIQWLGQACFKISEKIDGQEVIVVTAPFGKQSGLFPPKLKADIVTINKLDPAYNFTDKISGNISEQPMVIDRPGEYETKKVFVTGFEHMKKSGKTSADNSVIFKLDFGQISVAHLGGLSNSLTEDELDFIGDVDVLMIPVGNKDVLDSNKAAEVVRQVEPRLVIPMEYKIKGLAHNLNDETKFLKEMSAKAERQTKLKVSRKDLPEDKTTVVVLEKV
jgi:L-ascorbate metabolism protein UlaG (beta-lactamase superfamily)